MRLAPEVDSVVYDTGEQLHGGGYNPPVRRHGGSDFDHLDRAPGNTIKEHP
ncbi:hypothetical protein [Massilia sp. TN1-12]|uniref:hypothetical protein n=1 Tax=Massilia paldalensis TaxID=3377675 RepID=UPI00384A63A2